MIQSALVAYIKTIHARTYASQAPQKAQLPIITVDLESSVRNRHYGSSFYETGLIETDFEISVWSAKTSGAYDLAQSVISLLENFSGLLSGTDSPATVYSVGDLEIITEQSGFDGETELFQYSIFITITHTIAS
jgi:hypothetical protein